MGSSSVATLLQTHTIIYPQTRSTVKQKDHIKENKRKIKDIKKPIPEIPSNNTAKNKYSYIKSRIDSASTLRPSTATTQSSTQKDFIKQNIQRSNTPLRPIQPPQQQSTGMHKLGSLPSYILKRKDQEIKSQHEKQALQSLEFKREKERRDLRMRDLQVELEKLQSELERLPIAIKTERQKRVKDECSNRVVEIERELYEYERRRAQ
jgi:hypothetical protein